jgi:hypothetical protein
MRVMRSIATLIVFWGCTHLLANENIERSKLMFSLTRNNRANVVRLKNEKGIVKYILEIYLDGWEIDGPDEQLGGSLCLRLNRAGGKYLPGCLLCKPDAIKTYSPSDCLGVFTQDVLEADFENSKRGIPITFVGSGMRIKIMIKKLEFGDESLTVSDRKVKAFDAEMELIPDPSIPISKRFTRK